MLSQKKKLLPPYPPHLKKYHHTTLQNVKLLHLTAGNVVFLQMLVTEKSRLWVGIGGFEND